MPDPYAEIQWMPVYWVGWLGTEMTVMMEQMRVDGRGWCVVVDALAGMRWMSSRTAGEHDI